MACCMLASSLRPLYRAAACDPDTAKTLLKTLDDAVAVASKDAVVRKVRVKRELSHVGCGSTTMVVVKWHKYSDRAWVRARA
jgi:hypothetical protein